MGLIDSLSLDLCMIRVVMAICTQLSMAKARNPCRVTGFEERKDKEGLESEGYFFMYLRPFDFFPLFIL